MTSRPPTTPGLDLRRPVSVGVYDTYFEAQQAVDHLADESFPVEDVEIVGTDLRSMERVTGRLTRGRMAVGSACSRRGHRAPCSDPACRAAGAPGTTPPHHHHQEMLSMTTHDSATLYVLGDRGQTVDGSANDVRGRRVKDKDGHGIGRVADLIVDDQEKKVRFLLVDHGGFLGFDKTHTMIPVDAVSKVTEDEVVIDQSHERVASAPGYAPDLVDDRVFHGSLYSHYGYTPYWGLGYVDPSFMTNDPFGMR